MRRYRLLLSVSCLGLIGLLAAATMEPAQPAGVQDLLGCDPDVVIALYGVPDGVMAGGSALTLMYSDKNGGEAEFVFCGDAAVQVPASFQPGPITPARPGQLHAGQRAGVAARCMGNPKSVSHGTQTVHLEYADGRTVAMAHGRVLGVLTW